MQPCLDSISRDQLKKFCKLGRLFDVERLLAEKGTLRLRKTRKWTPLFMAVDRGFHSLVETLLRYDHAQWDLERTYEGAVRRRRNDLAGMILRSVWWTAEIDPIDALATGDTELVCKLMASGVDFTKDQIVNKAALRNSRGTIECLRAAKISIEAVEGQLYSALIAHALEGHVKSVVHLLKAGLDPHKHVVWYEHRDSSEDKISAVEAAICSHKPALFAMLKPSPSKDDAEHLIGSAMFLGDRDMLRLLLDAGFSLNCQDNGGSPALHRVLTDAGFLRISPDCRGCRPYDWSKLTEDIKWLIELGAKWVGRNRDDYRQIRDVLVNVGERGAKMIIAMLLDGHAISNSEIKELLRTPRMRHLAVMLRE